MGTINSAFSIISGALNADQSALNIVANNVANANTTGYTQEVPNWQENPPLLISGVVNGAGVTETGPTSVRDRVLTERLDQQQQLASASGSRLTALNTLQALFTPDSGASGSTAGDIGSDLTKFFSSFSSLEANPTNNALRQSVLSSASTLAGDISNAAASLNTQQTAVDQEASGVTSQVNSLTSAIAQINQQIMTISPGADAGTLEDQRQQDLSQLSQLVGINQITTENNGLAITTTGGQLLVSEDTSYPLTTGVVSGVNHFYVGTADVTSQLTTGGGQLGGYLTARDQDIPSVLSSLDQLAYSVSTNVNALNNSGTDMDGNTGTVVAPLNLFHEPTTVTGSAANMSVVMTDPNQIAAAGLGQGTGDNTNALAMANLANQSLIKPIATTLFSMTQNLNSATAVNGTATGQVELNDSLGKSYTATVTYTRTATGPPSTWNYSIAMPDPVTPDTSVAGQVSYSFGAGETVNPATNLTITGSTGAGTATITAPTVTPGEAVGTAGPPATGYVAALDAQLTAAGITGVTISTAGNVVTIKGATATAGNVVADPVSANATGTLQFNAGGTLTSPAANVSGITFSGLSNGAVTLSLNWGLFGSSGAANVTQTASATA
jgi:flagellar hook-associated protein 1 FlgK